MLELMLSLNGGMVNPEHCTKRAHDQFSTQLLIVRTWMQKWGRVNDTS